MATVDEALAEGRTPLGAALAAGVDSISEFQTVTFVKYVRVILPLDGFAFWVKASILNLGALANGSVPNVVVPNAAPGFSIDAATNVLEVKGSLHYATDQVQDEEETFATNRVVFTSEEHIQEFNVVGPNELYFASFENIRFAFSGRGSFYAQSNLWHYTGAALYADMATQVIDDPLALNANARIVSNSLPIWLGFNAWTPKDWAPIGNPVTLYPSYLTPLNLTPPFAAVHVVPESTTTIAIGATFDATLSETQLCRERVKVTLFGLGNDLAADFVSFVLQQQDNDPGLFGVMNSPVIRDEKRTQPELRTLAQKKVVEFDVNYYQSRARNVARELIRSAVPSFVFE